MLGIIGAMDEEVAMIKAQLTGCTGGDKSCHGLL